MFELEKFPQYTYGQDVTVQSDHKTLKIMMKKTVAYSTEALTEDTAATAEVLNKARGPPWQGHAFS